MCRYWKLTDFTQKSKVPTADAAGTWNAMCGVIGAPVSLVPELSQHAVLKSVHATVPEAAFSGTQ